MTLGDTLGQFASENGPLFVGLDFAFGFPEWYMDKNGWRTGRQLWEAAGRHGDAWLHDEMPPFWGRKRKRPPDEGSPRRATDIRSSNAPKSPFQIGGAGAVGTGSVRGMPLLADLSDAGFAVWPFVQPGERQPMVVEIYPRLLSGKVVKSDVADCVRHLERYAEAELPDFFRGMAAATEDSFDATVSALEMWRHADELASLRPVTGPGAREGCIWCPDG